MSKRKKPEKVRKRKDVENACIMAPNAPSSEFQYQRFRFHRLGRTFCRFASLRYCPSLYSITFTFFSSFSRWIIYLRGLNDLSFRRLVSILFCFSFFVRSLLIFFSVLWRLRRLFSWATVACMLTIMGEGNVFFSNRSKLSYSRRGVVRGIIQ